MPKWLSSFLTIFVLIFAGEAIFSLPFHITRFFRPAVLEVFEFSNTTLGDAFAGYGLLAMAAYLLGGPIADKYAPRALITLSLILTGLGGLVMAQIPGERTMTLLYAYWGATTLLLFWSPLIRATREWGGSLAQGQAFGLLDGGRGLVQAASASFAVIVFSWLLPAEVELATAAQSREALQSIIYLYTGLTLLAAAMVWFLLPTGDPKQIDAPNSILTNIKSVIAKPIVWAHAGIIVCAYCAYKGLDNYSLYCVEVLGMDQVEAARFTANAAYLRLFGAVLVGLLADKMGAARTIAATFITLFVCYLYLWQTQPETTGLLVLYANLLVTFFAAYAMRGIYYALLEEVRTPAHLTGTTVGLVAVLGYTPDVFFYPIAGRILDSAPGIVGHQLYFGFLASIMAVGLLITLVLIWLNRHSDTGSTSPASRVTANE
ncbi:MAG: nitrate/nitrite transporter [Pseudomonadales bacterium]